jgi:uncharacterized protein YcbX
LPEVPRRARARLWDGVSLSALLDGMRALRRARREVEGGVVTEMDRLFSLVQEQGRQMTAAHERLEASIARSNREHAAGRISIEDTLATRLDRRDEHVDEQITAVRGDISGLKVRLAAALGVLTSVIGATDHAAFTALLHGL